MDISTSIAFVIRIRVTKMSIQHSKDCSLFPGKKELCKRESFNESLLKFSFLLIRRDIKIPYNDVYINIFIKTLNEEHSL